jgi:predicted acyl esterase
MTTIPKDGAVQSQVLMKVYGDDAYPAWHRRPQPLDAARVRYPGFKPETVHLRAGEIRTEGALPLPSDIMLERDVAVTLRDGTVIYADVFRPVQPGTYPCVASFSPYGKQLGCQIFDDLPNRFGVAKDGLSGLEKFEGVDPALFVANGYVVLNPDNRGAYKSGGNLNWWGRQIAEDGYDVIEWAARQAWSNGKVGLAGNSWLCASQWFIAAERPPHLSAIAPWEGFSDIMREACLRGGIPRVPLTEFLTQTLAGENLLEDITRMTLAEQDDSPYWQDKAARLDRIEVPAYIVASYDNFAHARGTLEGFRRVASKDKWLRVHNTFEWPDFYDPQWSAELMAFFDHYMKGEDNSWQNTPRIRIAVLDPGSQDEVGRVVESWPPEGYPYQRLYLTAQGGLASELPAAKASLRYSVDGGRPASFRTVIDVEAELIGYMKLKLWVEADGADDMDLVIIVEKLDANGKPLPRSVGNGTVQPLQAFGFQRASRRRLDINRSNEAEPFLLMQGEERLAQGEVVPLEIGIWPTGLRIHAGEMLQVVVAPYHAHPLPFNMGSARISIPADRFTYRPGEQIEMRTLGGDVDKAPQWTRDQAVVDMPRNAGAHVLHMGGGFDSYLMLPLRTL